MPDLRSKFRGALLGTFVGDALGMPFEGASPWHILSHWPESRPMLSARLGTGTYTDDTQMMIGVAESLAARGGFDGADMAMRFVENYEVGRGYGSAARAVLAALADGCVWDRAATLVFREGSFGNGAAMRVAPVGAFCYHDPVELRRVAELSASITHGHPFGKEGAVVQARAVALAMTHNGQDLDGPVFLSELRSFAKADCEVFGRKLAVIEDLLKAQPDVDEVVEAIGNNVTAHGSVPAAIYSFLSHPDSFEAAVTYAVTLGGDTDTIAAMAGAIAGACHGVEAIPQEWVDALENGRKGRDYVVALADRLCDCHLRAHGG
jgi:ADP-ribosylglycohydrolase